MIDRVTFESTTFAPAPQRFEAGTPQHRRGDRARRRHPLGDVARTAPRWQARRRAVAARSAARCSRRFRACRLMATPSAQVGVLTFTMTGAHPHDIASILDSARHLHPRRAPLHPAAARALRRAGHGARLVRALHHRGRRPRAGARPPRGAGDLRLMADDERDVPDADHRARSLAAELQAARRADASRRGTQPALRRRSVARPDARRRRA